MLALVGGMEGGGVGWSEPEWSKVLPLAERSLLLDAVVVGERIIVVGERGHLLLSEDSGNRWTQIPVPTRTMLTGIAAAQGGRYWAVGHDATILQSADGGRSWVCQTRAPEEDAPLFDIWFADTEHGIAVGAYGLYLETSDGGSKWVRRSIAEGEPHLYAIAGSPSGNLYISGEFGRLFSSSDHGRQWNELPSPYEGSLFGVLPLANESVLVFGLRGNCYRTDDGGSTWRRSETGTAASLLAGLQTANGSLVIAGLGGAILISHDGGDTFLERKSGAHRGIAATVEVTPDRIMLVGEGGIRWLDETPG